jgi:hypothetical protein
MSAKGSLSRNPNVCASCSSLLDGAAETSERESPASPDWDAEPVEAYNAS